MKRTQRAKRKNLVGARVRQARYRLEPRASQDDLSGRLARLGVTIDRSAISKIESFERYVMDYEAAALARALRVTVAWLYGEEETLRSSASRKKPVARRAAK
ncbi:MAG: XRE family transcriptional regulator [Rhodospirillales bacterium]|nr:XRE family transcriptional regulator [Acetobacter sp.]